MNLHQSSSFEKTVLLAAEHFQDRGLRPSIIEKDYYVTETLRVVAATLGQYAIFKGGTSLVKGWELIGRFSEDIDVFLDPASFTPHLGEKGIDRELKRLCSAVGRHSGLTYLRKPGRTIGGRSRQDYFSFRQRFGSEGEVTGQVLLESGSASGREPTVDVMLSSYLAQYLRETGTTLGTDDESPFLMRLLHFRRTFVEKLFAIHSKVEILKRDGSPIRAYARHYYDLFHLAGRSEVREMLASPEYASIKLDYDMISRQYFARDYVPPTDLSFASSTALFPDTSISESLRHSYEQQCRLLCLGAFPNWREVLARFEEIRHLL